MSGLRIKELVFIALILLLPAAAWMFIFKPRNAATTALKADAAKIEEKLARLEQVETPAFIAVERDRAALRAKLTEIADRLPAREDVNDVYKELERRARAWDLDADVVSARGGTGAKEEEAFASESFDREHLAPLRLKGRFADFYAFLLGLESRNRMLYPVTLRVQRLSGENRGNVDVTLIMDYYYRKKQEAQADGTAK